MLTGVEILKSARTIVDNGHKVCILLLEDGDGVMARDGLPTVSQDKTLNSQIDWSQCTAVQRTPGILSGQWRVKGTRIPVDALIENYNAGHSADELATMVFVGLPIDLSREIIRYAAERS